MKTLISTTAPREFASLESRLLSEGFGPVVTGTAASHVLELLDAAAADNPFELVLLDVRLCTEDSRLPERIRIVSAAAHALLVLLVQPGTSGSEHSAMLAEADDFCVITDSWDELLLRIGLLRDKTREQRTTGYGALQTTLEAMPRLFLRLSSSGRILESNRAFRTTSGLDRQQLQQCFLLEHFRFQDVDAAWALIEKVLQTHTPIFSHEMLVSFNQDQPRWYLADMIPVQNHGKNVGDLLFFASDITPSKITGYALEDSEARYRNLLDRLPMAIIEQDFSLVQHWINSLREQGIADLRTWLQSHPQELEKALLQVRLMGANALSYSLFGAKSQCQFSMHAGQMLYGLDPVLGLEQIMALWERTSRIEFETHLQTLSGTLIHCIASFFPVENNGPDTEHRKILVLQDVTRLKRAEGILRSNEARYRAIVEDQTEFICRFLPGGKFSFVNGAFARYYGKSPEALIGHHFQSLIQDEEQLQDITRRIGALTPDTPVVTFENHSKDPDGQFHWQQWTLRAIYDQQNIPTEYQAVGRDVSWRKRIEHELQAAKEAAEQASHIKSTFLATVSHEIRTPLTAILGFSELLLRKKDLPEDKQLPIKRIFQAGERLLALINDVLDLSKIEANKLEMEENDFSLQQMTIDLVGMFLDLSQEKGVELDCDLDPELPHWVRGSEKRLHQVLANLLSNAVKFTDQGTVQLRIRKGPRRTAEFSVSDTGIGIPEDKLEAIFDPFIQAGGFVTRKYGGTGLGLSISKRLVTMMGGTLSVQSTPGKGTTFRFTIQLSLPLDPQQPLPDEKALPQPRRNLNILLVDDDRSNLEIAKAFFLDRGHRVETADNGSQAVALRTLNEYSLILMDVQMSPMDGLEATRRIREWEMENSAPYTPIIALTAHAMKGDKERFLRAGMDGYGAKPFDFKKLVETMSELMSRPRDADGRLLPEASCPLSPKTPQPPEPETIDESGTPILDMHQVLENMSLRIWRIGAQVFLEDTPEQVEELRALVRSSQYDAARNLAHKLKGASGNVGALRLHHLCKEMEQAADQHNTLCTEKLLNLILECWPQTQTSLTTELTA